MTYSDWKELQNYRRLAAEQAAHRQRVNAIQLAVLGPPEDDPSERPLAGLRDEDYLAFLDLAAAD